MPIPRKLTFGEPEKKIERKLSFTPTEEQFPKIERKLSFGEQTIKTISEAAKGVARGVERAPIMFENLWQTGIDNIRSIAERQLVEEGAVFGISDEEFESRTPEQKERIGRNTAIIEALNKAEDNSKRIQGIWEKAASTGIEARDPKIFQGTFMQNPSWTRAIALSFESAPLLGLAVASSYATKSPITGATLLGSLEAAGEHRAAREAGKTIEKANLIGMSDAVALSALEILPITGFMKGGKIATRMFRGAIQEGGEEVLQGLWTNSVAKIGYDETRELTEGLVESFIAGAGSGGVVGAFSPGVAKGLDSKIAIAKESGIDVDAMITAVGNQVKNNAEKLVNTVKKINEKVGEKGQVDLAPEAEPEPLTEQAKKYKTAEEFVKEQGTPLFHGTSEKFEEFDITKAGTLKTSDWGTKGVYFDPSKMRAEYYRDEAVGTTDKVAAKAFDELEKIEKTLKPKSEYDSTPDYTKEWEDKRQEWLKLLDKARKDKTKGRVIEAYLDPKAKIYKHIYEPGMITNQTLADEMAEKGYDAVEIWDRDPDTKEQDLSEVIVMNTDVIKTKQQLTDIWEKAQQPPVKPPKKPPVAEGVPEDRWEEEKSPAELAEEEKALKKFGAEEVSLMQAVKKSGGIKAYKGGREYEEYKELPLGAKSHKGLPLDEMVAELEQYGFNFKDGEELRQALIAYAPPKKGYSAEVKEYLAEERKLKKESKELISEKIKGERALRKKIHAWRSVKGMSKSQLTDITKKITGQKSLSSKEVTEEQLEKILKSVKASRPKRVGHKTVITKTTEDRIQTLKQSLIDRGEITEEIYNKILELNKAKSPKYTGKGDFITETKGKEIIKNMLDAVPIVTDQIAIDKGLEANPAIKKEVESIKKGFEKKYKEKSAKINSLLDMHHFADSMEKQTGVPFGRFQEKITRKRKELTKKIESLREEVRTVKDYKKIIKNSGSLRKINDYVASKLPDYVKGKPEKPTNMTESEIKIAETIQKQLKGFEDDVRYNRFYEWYDYGTRIPNAPESELRRATEILETKGDEALREWLKGRSWGIIRTGYDVGEVIKPSLKTFKAKPGVSKGHLKPRETINFKRYERDIIQRYFSYVRQMTYKTEFNRDIKALRHLWDTNRDLFSAPDKVATLLNNYLYEVLGQRDPKSVLETWFFNVYSQAARALFLDARKGVRNLFQNLAFFPSSKDFLKMKPLTSEEKEYFKTYVSQNLGIKYDLQMLEYKGIPGLRTLNEMADAVNVMGKTDEINRLVSFNATVNRVKGAMKDNPDFAKDDKALDKMLKKAGITDLEDMEIVHALELFVTQGKEEMANYIAKAVTQKVHFLYERSQRSPAEQGGNLRRVLSNLLTFKKGYAQRLAMDIRKLKRRKGRGRSLKSVIGATVLASFVGALYMKLTGDERNPYSVDKILGDLSLGGLAIGTQEQVSSFTRDLVSATTGDKAALGRTINNIVRAEDMFIPFYDEAINALEVATDTYNLDKAVLRQIRTKFDDRYEGRELSYYRKERTGLKKVQHGLFGTDKRRDVKKKEEKSKKKERKLNIKWK